MGVVAEALAFLEKPDAVAASREVRVAEACVLHVLVRGEELAHGFLYRFAIERN